MKFPITRFSLQVFDYEKDQEEEKQEAVDKILKEIMNDLCKLFKKTIRSNRREQKFVWNHLHVVRQIFIPGFPTPSIDEYVPQFIEKLKDTFIGCDIIMDPMKTYIIIKWE